MFCGLHNFKGTKRISSEELQLREQEKLNRKWYLSRKAFTQETYVISENEKKRERMKS